jgi:TetR/AcrR family transcriptional repressor of nem operon
MRKSKAETAETREYILTTAALVFRRDGIADTSLSDVMHAAGLTHGGFYRHFQSKEQLVSEALQKSFDISFDGLEAAATGKHADEAVSALVNYYLSPKRRDNFQDACPLAALGSDLRHGDAETRGVATVGWQRLIGILQSKFDGLTAREARIRATAMASTMVGSMMLSRILEDTAASNALLKDTREFLAHR